MRGREQDAAIKRLQLAVNDIVWDICKDGRTVGLALMELSLLIAISTRSNTITRLEHRDRVLECVRGMHDVYWEHTGELYDRLHESCDE